MKNLLTLTLILFVTGCSSSAHRPPLHTVDTMLQVGIVYPIDVDDPMEKLNRGVFYFNAKFDNMIFVPAVDMYQAITPDAAEKGIHNVFENVDDISTFLNQVLQTKLKKSGQTLSRFVVNSTVGVAGLFDVASKIGIPKYKEDLGQTLGHYGVGDGPFFVLPILGPSNLRDTTGLAIESAAFAAADPLDFDANPENRMYYYAPKSLDARAQVEYRYYQMGSPFEYEYIRFLYTKKRQLDVMN